MKKFYLTSLILFLINGTYFSQNLLGLYQFTSAQVCPNEDLNVVNQPVNAVFSEFQSQGVNCNPTANVFNNSGWNTSVDIDLTEFVGFTITAEDCYRLNLDSLVYLYRNSGTSTPPMWFLRSSIDNYSTNIAAGQSSASTSTMFNNQIVLTGSEYSSLNEITFRFYITGIATSSTTFRLDDVKIYGTIDYVGPIDLYVDADGDGFGTGTVVQTFCSNPGGYATNNTDCNDADPLLNPSTIWYEDLDNDDYGNNDNFQIGCSTTFTNAALLGNDCNEFNPAINPTTIWYEDADNDGYGNIEMTETNCYSQAFINAVLNGDDCMDDQVTVYPGAPEICDDFDNNCDGDINEDLTFTTYYIDNDDDDYGSGNAGDFCENPGIGYSLENTDCDDNDSAINPNAEDILGDAIDQNCDGIVDGYVGLFENFATTFSIAPNPGNDYIHINSTQSGFVEIRNIEGKLIRLVDFSKNVTINMSDVSKGIYFINLGNQTLKWLKQ